MEPELTLIIGTKNWSSWSLRPWYLMSMAAIPFGEIEIPLRTPESAEALKTHSPSGLVPVLKTADGIVIWDSLAIAEFLADRFPERDLWPSASHARAMARAVSAEMHAGFRDLRMEWPMDIVTRITPPRPPSAGAARDIARICEIWLQARTAHAAAGPYLFGQFSIADAMYAPVVSRFMTYGQPLEPTLQAYADTIWTSAAMRQWRQACEMWAAAGGATPYA
jgi:glutathione S-transferase